VINQGLGQKCICMFLCFVGACQRFFLLARFGRKTDGHIKKYVCFFKFFMFFFAYRQGLKPDLDWASGYSVHFATSVRFASYN